MDVGELVRNVDALLPEDWAKPDEEDIRPQEGGTTEEKYHSKKLSVILTNTNN